MNGEHTVRSVLPLLGREHEGADDDIVGHFDVEQRVGDGIPLSLAELSGCEDQEIDVRLSVVSSGNFGSEERDAHHGEAFLEKNRRGGDRLAVCRCKRYLGDCLHALLRGNILHDS